MLFGFFIYRLLMHWLLLLLLQDKKNLDMDNKYDVFISYSRHDTNVVNEFVYQLEREGFSVWIDRNGIESGDAFKRIILQAIKNSAVVLFFSSQFSNQSSWTAKEIGVAVKYKKPIIPILLDGSNFNEEVEFDLINLDFINYQDVAVRGTMMDRLVKSLKAKIPNLIGLKKSEAAERERLERERRQKEETEKREREEAERKSQEEAERQAREAAERERKALQNTNVSSTSHSDTPAPKSKKGLWIGLGIVAAVVVLVVVLAKSKHSPSYYEESVEEMVEISDSGGHEYVDLGLPSGTLWATCNVGANKPEGYGSYFAWGETQRKMTFNGDTYKYCNGSLDKLTKYCSEFDLGNNGFTDSLTTLQADDDPATAKWGNGWHMPSKVQWEELKENTTHKWTTRNGKKGRLFTAKNGLSVFLPAAGYRCGWISWLYEAGSTGYYWSRSLGGDSSMARQLYFNSEDCLVVGNNRILGCSVRPVREK